MKYLNRFILFAMVLFVIIAWSGCCCPAKVKTDTATQKTTVKSDSLETPARASSDDKKAIVETGKVGMKIAFTYPVVAVDGKRAPEEDIDSQRMIEISSPENSQREITLGIMDPEGNEQTIQGILKTYRYTQYSKPGTVIVVLPEDPDATYYSLLRNGYGEFSVREYVQRAGSAEEQGPVLVELTLGSKKKIAKE